MSKRDERDVNELMNRITIIFAIVFSLGMTALYIWFNHQMSPIDFFGAIFKLNKMKITAQVTGNIFTGLVAFGFLGALIMVGVKKIVLHFVKKNA